MSDGVSRRSTRCSPAGAWALALLASACAAPSAARPPLPSEDFGPAAAPDGSAPAGRPASAAAEPDLARLASPVRLADLLPVLLARNPRVRAARARLEAAAERHPQAVALPDPMAEVQYFTKNAMAGDANYSRYDVMVRQDFPFPTVLVLRGDSADKAAEAEALRYEAAVRDAVADLKDVHAERAYLAQAERVQQALRDVYRRYAELARGEASGDPASGRTRLAESFRAEALLAQADYERTLLAEVRAAEDQRLRSLLAIPRSVALGEPADAPPAVPLDLDVEALTLRALERNQEVRAAGVEAEAAEIGERLAKWDYAPTFSVGGGQMINDEFDAATGRKTDSAVLTFGMTLPIQYGAKSAAVREAAAKLRAARAAETGERERVAADVARLGFRLRNSSRLAVLYGRDLVPQAETALLRSQAMLQEGGESLSSSLELAATWQQLRIAELRARADEAQAVAALERVLGASLALVPPPAARTAAEGGVR